MYKSLVTVDGVAFPEPSTYNGNTSTLVDEGRSTSGLFVGTVVRDDMAKIEIGWNFLTIAQWAEINACFKISAGGKFINSVTFLDQSTGKFTTRNMYVSDRSAGLLNRDARGEFKGWKEPKMSLIEV